MQCVHLHTILYKPFFIGLCLGLGHCQSDRTIIFTNNPSTSTRAYGADSCISNQSSIPCVIHVHYINDKNPRLLPPASEGWGTVMFSVCPHLGGGGVSPAGEEGGWFSPARGGLSPAGGGGGVSPAGGLGQSSWRVGGGQSARGGQSAGGGSINIGQEHEYLLHGERYASCVRAGGLSCYITNLAQLFEDQLC